MSAAQVTEAHRQAAFSIFELAMKWSQHGAPFREPCAQLIADSEAKAVAEWQDSAHLKGAAIDSLLLECDRLRAEVEAECLLNGKGAEREASLLGKLERAEREVERLKADGAASAFIAMSCRASRAEAESIQLKKTNVENADSYRLMQGRVIAAEVEVERLKARLYQGCDDERDMAISEGPGHSTCGLADELTERAERAEAELAIERARLDWLDNHLNYELMITVFGEEIGIASDGGPRELRSAIDAAMKEHK